LPQILAHNIRKINGLVLNDWDWICADQGREKQGKKYNNQSKWQSFHIITLALGSVIFI
jgi:hypothetical protein